MNHVVNVRVFSEYFIQRLLVGDVDIVVYGPLSADDFDSVDDFLRRVV